LQGFRPAHIHDQIIKLALEQSEPSPQKLAVRFTDEKRYFVSGAPFCRLLKAHDLITSSAYALIKAADRSYADDASKRDVADRFYLLQDHRAGLARLWAMPPACHQHGRRLRYLSAVLGDCPRHILACWRRD
jgi:hypothetical protein